MSRGDAGHLAQRRLDLADAVVLAADQYLEAEHHLDPDARLAPWRQALLDAVRAFEDETAPPFGEEHLEPRGSGRARFHDCAEWEQGSGRCGTCGHAAGSHRSWGDYCKAECRYCECSRYRAQLDPADLPGAGLPGWAL